jgi:hypothetical protein
MGTLPQAAIDILPFSSEPMSQWKKGTDVRNFADALYATTDVPSHGASLCTEVEKEIRKYARMFTRNLQEAQQPTNYIDFYQDPHFGLVAKYSVALKCCITSLLEDAGFYSLAHILETESDTECSLLLASNFYYKQSIQMLRNILEETFMPLHFCDNTKDFDDWKANNYRVPKLRGREGLIKKLVNKGIISNSLSTRIADLYGKLSGYIHGSENTLIHQNIHSGENHKVEFNSGEFYKWCEIFRDCMDICIELLKINFSQWHSIHSTKLEELAKIGKTLCNICHNEDTFDKWFLSSEHCFISKNEEQETNTDNSQNIEPISFYRYICLKCGHKIIINANKTAYSIVHCFQAEGLPPSSVIEEYAFLVRSSDDPFCQWYTVQPEGMDIVSPLLVHMDI